MTHMAAYPDRDNRLIEAKTARSVLSGDVVMGSSDA
jgi:hypothetical protein